MATTRDWRRIVQDLKDSVQSKGFNIVHPLTARTYNRAVPLDFQLQGVNPTALLVMIGNTKTLWEPFTSYYHKVELPVDPLNSYSKMSIQTAAKELSPTKTYWADETEPGKILALQRMITVSKLGSLCKTSHLCIHPVYGPWFAIRAVLVFNEIVGPEDTSKEQEFIAENPLELATVVEEAIATGSWEKWLEVRRKIHPNHPWEFSPLQIAYHYHHSNVAQLHNILRHGKLLEQMDQTQV